MKDLGYFGWQANIHTHFNNAITIIFNYDD